MTSSSSTSAAAHQVTDEGRRPTTTLPSPPSWGARGIRALERAPGPEAPTLGRETLSVRMYRGCAAAGLGIIAIAVTTAAALHALRRSRIVVVRSDRWRRPAARRKGRSRQPGSVARVCTCPRAYAGREAANSTNHARLGVESGSNSPPSPPLLQALVGPSVRTEPPNHSEMGYNAAGHIN